MCGGVVISDATLGVLSGTRPSLVEPMCIIFDIPGKMTVRVLSIECINLVLEEALQRGAQCYKCV